MLVICSASILIMVTGQNMNRQSDDNPLCVINGAAPNQPGDRDVEGVDARVSSLAQRKSIFGLSPNDRWDGDRWVIGVAVFGITVFMLATSVALSRSGREVVAVTSKGSAVRLLGHARGQPASSAEVVVRRRRRGRRLRALFSFSAAGVKVKCDKKDSSNLSFRARIPFGLPLRRDGEFSGSQKSGRDTVAFGGVIVGHKASGWIGFSRPAPDRCDGTVRWHASS